MHKIINRLLQKNKLKQDDIEAEHNRLVLKQNYM